MNISRTATGFEAVLHSTGIWRFFGSGFLGLWLIGWLAGEVFALWIGSVGAWSLFTGHPPEAGRQPVNLEVGVVAGLFLIFWLTMWTVGGIAALFEFLRLLFGKDRIIATDDGVRFNNGYGLFHTNKNLRRDEIRSFYCRPGRAALCADTMHGSTELTRLGTWKERFDLEQELNRHFELSVQRDVAGILPPGWCEISSLEHEAILVKDPATRRKQARVTWSICLIPAFIAAYLVAATEERPHLWTLAILMSIVTAPTAWGAVWLSIGRIEWLLESGHLTLQRRFGQGRVKKFEATALELIEDNSGDSGPDYRLLAVAPEAGPRPSNSYRIGKQRRVIYSESNDPTLPRNLGLWLRQRCSIPFSDETTAEAKAKQLAEIRVKLTASGRIGRLTLRLIERLAANR